MYDKSPACDMCNCQKTECGQTEIEEMVSYENITKIVPGAEQSYARARAEVSRWMTGGQRYQARLELRG
jgi:hypothetical protein